ncbi:MAG: tetratricopeptide repeat protein [Nitrospirae bacterium]|nr:tetratricopeptide repeat protein [Nitrospirota bacterium]
MFNTMIDKRTIFISILLVGLSFGVYLPALKNDFVSFDDGVYVFENYRVLDGLTWDGIVWAFKTPYDSNWFPLTLLSHMCDVELFGVNPAGHHFTNIIIHAIISVLLFLFFYHTTRNAPSSALAAALFAIHPLNVESVAWAAERKNVLSTFFWIAAVCAYAGYVKRRDSGLRASVYYAAVIVLFICSLMSKPMAVTFPFTLLILDYWPLSRLRDRPAAIRSVIEKIPLFFITAVFTIITVNVQHAAIAGTEALPLVTRVLNALTSYVLYIWKMIYPVNLAVIYPYLPIKSVWPAIGSFVLLIGITAGAFLVRKRQAYLMAGWLWYLGTMVPVIQIVQVGLAPMADRYAYVPAIGIFIMAAWGLWDALNRRGVVFILASILIIAVFSALTWRQSGYWRDSGTLFKHALDVTVNNYAAHNSYGVYLLKQNRFDEALVEFYKGLEVMPDDPLLNFNTWSTLTHLGKDEEAKKYYAKSLPYWKEGRQPHLYKLLGISYMNEKNYGEAAVYFKKSLALNPKDLDAINYLGLALMSVGNNEEALSSFNRALALEADRWEILFNKGLALITLRRLSEAEACFKETLRLNPGYAPAKNKLDMLERARGVR